MVTKEQLDEFYNYMTDRTKSTIGAVLTILEATGMSEPQEKAAKDLVKKEVWRQHEEVSHFFWQNIAPKLDVGSQ